MAPEPSGVWPTGPNHALQELLTQARTYQWYEVPGSRPVTVVLVTSAPTACTVVLESSLAISNRLSLFELSDQVSATVPAAGEDVTRLFGCAGTEQPEPSGVWATGPNQPLQPDVLHARVYQF